MDISVYNIFMANEQKVLKKSKKINKSTYWVGGAVTVFVLIVLIVRGTLFGNVSEEDLMVTPEPTEATFEFLESDYAQVITLVKSSDEGIIVGRDSISNVTYSLAVLSDDVVELNVILPQTSDQQSVDQGTRILLRDNDLDKIPDEIRVLAKMPGRDNTLFAEGFQPVLGTESEEFGLRVWNAGVSYLINFYIYRLEDLSGADLPDEQN